MDQVLNILINGKTPYKRKTELDHIVNVPKLKKKKLVNGQTNITGDSTNSVPDIIDTMNLITKEEKKIEQKRKINDKEERDEEPIPIKLRKTSISVNPNWQDYELIQEQYNLNYRVALNITRLLKNDNTVPFIARYRRNETDNMSSEDLRDIKESLDKIEKLKVKMSNIYKQIEKQGALNNELEQSILSARNIETLEHLGAPFKVENVRSLAQRAKNLGLMEAAENIISGKDVNLKMYVKTGVSGLETPLKVRQGIIHLIAQKISSDPETLQILQKLKKETFFILESKKAQKKTIKTETEESNKSGNCVSEIKYANYFDFRGVISSLKPHQILAINRGESMKVLSVKVIVPDYFFNKFKYFCIAKWNNNVILVSFDRNEIIQDSIQDAYTRMICPLIKRQLRSELKQRAEKAAIEVFSGNLKQMLLAAPFCGKHILGVDPGFSHGCKLAMISETGSVIVTNVVFPHTNNKYKAEYEGTMQSLILQYKCTIIALGNGTACRETEVWISDMINRDLFKPLDVKYTIVSENGASIYSCSPEAKKEFPKMDPNLISAVSIARRIQEPLAELVKIEPKHLGVGMYQHDIPSKKLEEALNDIVSECVSFVGVDINTSSNCLLRHIAGLSEKRAAEIIKYREEHGQFTSREQIKNVKGIGEKIFNQCAGFLKVRASSKSNKLDQTIIHPESYKITKDVLKKLNLKVNGIGEENFINTIITSKLDLTQLAVEFNTSLENLQLIFDALSKPLNHDLRDEKEIKPLFKSGILSVEDLKIGSYVSGRVENVTHFGCFVDIGVGCNGLLHLSKMKGNSLQIGDHIEVVVISLELRKGRIGLEYIKNM